MDFEKFITEKAIRKAREKYSPHQLAQIDCKIRQLNAEHYRYCKMPLVIGKARGIQNILRIFYSVNVSIYYVWDVLKTLHHEQDYINDGLPF